MSRYVPYSEVRKRYNVRPQTVQNWAKLGRVRYKAIQNATRKTWLYDLDSIGELIDLNADETESKSSKNSKGDSVVLYCRVSSKKQQNDLDRQRELLSKAFPDAKITEDIGSGLNYKRPGLSNLVKRVCRDEITQIVVTYKDRLMRFGYELFEQLCAEHGTKILVYCKNELTDNDESELKDDLLSIINVFVARNNGRRAGYLRKQRKLQKEQTNDQSKDQTEDSDVYQDEFDRLLEDAAEFSDDSETLSIT